MWFCRYPARPFPPWYLGCGNMDLPRLLKRNLYPRYCCFDDPPCFTGFYQFDTSQLNLHNRDSSSPPTTRGILTLCNHLDDESPIGRARFALFQLKRNNSTFELSFERRVAVGTIIFEHSKTLVLPCVHDVLVIQQSHSSSNRFCQRRHNARLFVLSYFLRRVDSARTSLRHSMIRSAQFILTDLSKCGMTATRR